MIRHARMLGRPTLFLPGLDHAEHRRPVRPRPDPRQGRARAAQSLGRERYLERMRDVRRGDPEVILDQQRRVGASLDWGRLRFTMDEVSARAVREAFQRLYREGSRTAPRRSSTGARAAGRACPTSRSSRRPRPGRCGRVRYHLIDDATGAARPRRDHHRRHDPPGDDPRRHRRRRPSRRPALRGARRPPRAHPVRRARRAGHRRRGRRPGVRHRRRQDHARPTTTTTTRPASGTACRCSTILDDEARVTGTGTPYDGLDRYEARRRILADLDARGRPRRRARRTRWSSAAASAATTSSSRASRPSGSSGRRRSRPPPSRRRGPAGRRSCPSGSRRSGSTG